MTKYSTYGGYQPYVRVADRRAKAAKELAARSAKGNPAEPVVITGRAIAHTFWGKSWCENLERYSDFANRLPRGRTYVRNGSVIDLRVSKGKVEASVMGSRLYKVTVTVAPVLPARWAELRRDCAGTVDSLVELLAGRLSTAVMTRLCERTTGLFPQPSELTLRCSCPDYATMCKHVAATLYGIGARFDLRPELLFDLRGVSPADLITGASSAGMLGKVAPSARALDDDDLSAMFGIDLDDAPARPVKASVTPPSPTVVVTPPKAAAPKAKPAPKREPPAPTTDPDMPETITSQGLLDLGIPRTTFQNWISKGTLPKTDVRGVYRMTPAGWEAIGRFLGC
ncbi:MAG: SWIM zinc finger family protein [Myxococcales bacterium]|nr:SWIM zinc finger family protein [Myxococcales bacterium]